MRGCLPPELQLGLPTWATAVSTPRSEKDAAEVLGQRLEAAGVKISKDVTFGTLFTESRSNCPTDSGRPPFPVAGCDL
jgi:hypothetical protein